jgi:hypothetical protein
MTEVTQETPEEREEFNRVERGSKAKQESIRGIKHPTREQLMAELNVAQMLIRELGDRLAKLEKPWVDLTQEECFELCVKHKNESFSLLVAVQDKLKEKNYG